MDISKIQLENNIYNIKDETAREDLQTFETSTNQEINNLKAKFAPQNFKNRKFLFVGDSYAVGYQGSGVDNIEGYFTKVVNKLGLNAQIVCANGYGFMGIDNNLLWKDLLSNTDIPNKNTFTDVIVCGGMNDRNVDSNFVSYMQEFFSYVQTNFPNAEIHVGCVGRYNISSEENLNNMHRVARLYKYITIQSGHKYINNSELILHNMSWFISDNIHPNTVGEQQLAYGIEQYIVNGKISDILSITNSNYFQQDIISSANETDLSNFSCYSYIDKNITTWLFSGAINFTSAKEINNLTDIVIGQLTNSYVCGSAYNQGLNEIVDGYVYSTTPINNSNFVKVKFRIYNDNLNNIHLNAFTVMDNGNLNNLNVTQIAFPYGAIKCICDSFYC